MLLDTHIDDGRRERDYVGSWAGHLESHDGCFGIGFDAAQFWKSEVFFLLDEILVSANVMALDVWGSLQFGDELHDDIE